MSNETTQPIIDQVRKEKTEVEADNGANDGYFFGSGQASSV